MARRVAFFGLLVSFSVHAQVLGIADSDVSRGATLLPESTAWADNATAPTYNPAGVVHVGPPEFFYAHERSVARGLVIDGVYGAASLGFVGLGGSIEWVRSPATSHRRSSFTVALGGELLSLGAAFNGFTGAPVNRLFTVDLGLMSRPVRGLSFGARVRSVNAPSVGLQAFDREYEIGLGIRPPWLNERLTLGVDYGFGEKTGVSQSRLAYTLQGRVINGLSLSAGLSHGFGSTTPFTFQAGLTVDPTAFAGVSYAFSGTSDAFNHLLAVRLSVSKYPSLRISGGKIAVISLSDVGAVPTSGLASLLGVSGTDPYLTLIERLDAASRDEQLRGVVLKIEGAGVGAARAKELRDAVLTLRAKGKTVVAYVLSASDGDYLVASACDKIYAASKAMLLIDGLQASTLFIGNTMEKLGVSWDVAKVGAYKNAPDQLTRSSMTPEQREATDALLDTGVTYLSRWVTEARPRLTPQTWKASIDEGLKSAQRAKELGLIDDVLTPAALEEQLRTLMPGARVAERYSPDDERTGRWGHKRQIAIVPVLGSISGGKDQNDPVGLQRIAGAESFIRAIEAAVQNPDVAAIVVRVDSGGGDGLASHLMYRAVVEAKKHKPVIASMGDVAASGGYYVAMGADEVWAQATTVTGSIGVFFIKPALQNLGEKLGIRQETIRRGPLAGITDLWEPWTDAQRTAAQKWVDDFYDAFIQDVAEARKKEKRDVDGVARGRVWSGADAKDRGLVDKLGSLQDAVASARQRAGIVPSEDVEWFISGAQGGGLAGALLTQVGLELPQPAPAFTVPPSLRELLGDVATQAQLPQGLQARSEIEVRIR
ncbi:MAG: signal peptide peptidase SppA [Myxococcaceae bacterium]|nr:signal peptide peptidase SppA [Myxococcaceae bacterium]